MAAPDAVPTNTQPLRQAFRSLVPRPVRAALHAALIAPTRLPGVVVRQVRRAGWRLAEMMRKRLKVRAKPKAKVEQSAASYWSNHAGYKANWYQFCAPYINERVTGDPKRALTPWALSVTGKPEHLLEVGCLDGKKIVALLNYGRVTRASGMDIAAGAIARGRELYPDLNLFVGDLNNPDLPEETYDVILANGVLHHIENIDVCVHALHAALKPGGWLISGDFTGPRRYAYTDEEIALIREGQAMLPKELRGAAFHPDQLASKLAHDPSESITTTAIVPILRAVFEDVTERRYGGNVLMRALTKTFFRNFDATNPEHIAAVERLQDFDRAVSQDYSHHTYCLSRKAQARVEAA